MQKGFDQIAQRIDGIRMVAVERNDDVTSRLRKSLLIGPAISTVEFLHDQRAHTAGHVRGSVCGVVIYNNDFVNK